MEFLGEFGDDEKSPPAVFLLRFENVAENVVADVHDVLAFSFQKLKIGAFQLYGITYTTSWQLSLENYLRF